MAAPQVSPGQKFDRWTVISPASPFPNGEKRWLCGCVCGTLRVVRQVNLIRRATKSCGCLRRERRRLPGGLGAARTVYRTFRNRARLKGWEFTLSEHQLYSLLLRPCYYCGAVPKVQKGRRRKRGSAEYVHETVTFGSVDRKDSSKGYTLPNCVPCCETCNTRKRDKAFETFCLLLKAERARALRAA